MARFPRHSVPASLWRIPAGPVAEVSCRTIATAPAWMRGAILPCAPQATLQPNHTLPLFLAGVSESDTPRRLARAITSGQTKKRQSHDPSPSEVDHGLWRLTLWPLSIFRTISRRHVRQYTGSPWASVSGVIRSSRWFRPHSGQVIHPSFTIMLSHFRVLCNGFPSLSFVCAYRSTRFQD